MGIINNIGLSDKKQLSMMLSEFIRNGTTSKNKITKQKSWNFIYISINTKYENDGKISPNVLDSIEKGLKQGLSNNDRIIQNGAFKILNLLYDMNERERVEKLFGRMSASAQKVYYKKHPISTPPSYNKNNSNKNNKLKVQQNGGGRGRRLSVGQISISDTVQSRNHLKRDSLEIKNGKIGKTKDKGKGKGNKMKDKDKGKNKDKTKTKIKGKRKDDT